MTESNAFIEDGWQRARGALRPVIQEQVAAEYAPRLAKAEPDVRAAIRREMESEVERRIDEQAPEGGLY